MQMTEKILLETMTQAELRAQACQVSKFGVSHLTSIPTLAVIYIVCRAILSEISKLSTQSGPPSSEVLES